jgi:hypothetical protein
MKCANHLQYQSCVSLSGSLSLCMTYSRFGWSVLPYVHFHRIIHLKGKFFSGFCGECNKVWQILSKLLSHNTEGWLEWFLSCMLPVSWKQFTRHIVSLFGTGESGNVSLNSFWQVSKNEMPGNVCQLTFVTRVKKKSLQFDCWKTSDRLSWGGYNKMWLVCLLYSHSNIVCLLTCSLPVLVTVPELLCFSSNVTYQRYTTEIIFICISEVLVMF